MQKELINLNWDLRKRMQFEASKQNRTSCMNNTARDILRRTTKKCAVCVSPQEGFVLLEAIIAVGVLVTIFAATITLYVSSVGGLRISNDQLIATYLAQDGMEQVIAKRQYNYDNSPTWLDGLSNCIPGPCSAEYFEREMYLPLPACVADCALYIDANGEYSSDSSGKPSHFKRKINITWDGISHEAYVTVSVSWPDGPDTLQVPVSYTLYNDPN